MMKLDLEITYNTRGHLTSPFMKALIKLDKEIKRMSTKYIINASKGVIYFRENKKGIIGRHISIINNDKISHELYTAFENRIVEINGEAFDALIKNYKKDMVAMTTYQDTNRLIVTLNTGDGLEIGKIITDETELLSITTKIKPEDYEMVYSNTFIELTDNDIEMANESIYRTMIDDIHVRITKQLIPGISNKYRTLISVDSERLEKIGCEEVCSLYIKQCRDCVDNIHIYRIIKY